MSIYASPQNLLSHVATSVTALAEIATPDDHAVVSGELLRTAIEDGDLSIFSVDEVAAVEAAINNIQIALDAMADKMTGRLRNRYPNSSSIAGDASLRGINCDMAIYQIYGLRTDEDVIRRYKEALADLRMIAKGEIHIGIETADISQAVGIPEVSAPPRIFSSDALKDF